MQDPQLVEGNIRNSIAFTLFETIARDWVSFWWSRNRIWRRFLFQYLASRISSGLDRCFSR
jgi:hypothetical protein